MGEILGTRLLRGSDSFCASIIAYIDFSLENLPSALLQDLWFYQLSADGECGPVNRLSTLWPWLPDSVESDYPTHMQCKSTKTCCKGAGFHEINESDAQKLLKPLKASD